MVLSPLLPPSPLTPPFLTHLRFYSLCFSPYSCCIHHNSAVAAVACGTTADSVAQIALRVFCYLCALAIAIAMQQVLVPGAGTSLLPTPRVEARGASFCILGATSCSGKRFLSGQKLNRFRKSRLLRFP